MAQESPRDAVPPSTVEVIQREARDVGPLLESDLAKQFLGAADALHAIDPRVIWRNADTSGVVSGEAFQRMSEGEREGFEELPLDERYYYLTRHGTPVAFSLALEFAAKHELSEIENARICDFGFSTIGHLRMLASLGAQVHGIEINPITEVLYSFPGDQGPIARADGGEQPGTVALHYGSFPSDTEIVDAIKAVGPLDVFFSKNTLKLGYIHPEREVDPRMTIKLGVSDREFCATVHDLLKPGGLFVIYNLYPKPSTPDEAYRPWADGRCPFEKELLEEVGFEVLEFNRDDSQFAREMAGVLGWDENMDLENDLFGMVTVLRRR